MDSVLGILLSYLLLYRYVALFAIVFSAGVIVPFPVNTILVAVGAFSSQGFFDFGASLAVAVVANVLGDCVGYFITKRYGHNAIKKYYEKKSSYFARVEHYIEHHVGLTIFISRFVGILGVVVNFLSGLIGIPLRTFLLFDFLGNFSDLFFMMAFGYFVCNYWEHFSSAISIGGGILLVLFLIFVVVKANRKKREQS